MTFRFEVEKFLICSISALDACRWAFRELRDIAEMKFRFAEEEDACEYVTRVAGEAHQYAPAHVLKARVRSPLCSGITCCREAAPVHACTRALKCGTVTAIVDDYIIAHDTRDGHAKEIWCSLMRVCSSV
jgi:hypothetical protein